jgi:hypothetical protein
MPTGSLYAVPTDLIPARSRQAAAIIHMLLNNLDPRYEAQSTYTVYKEYHSVCPLVGIGTRPTPNRLSPARVPLPPKPKGEGAHSPAGEGLGESQYRRLEKKLSTLPTLWYEVCQRFSV